MADKPKNDLLGVLYMRQIRKSVQFENTLTLLNMEVTQKQIEKSYDIMHNMVDKHLEATKQNRNDGIHQNGWGTPAPTLKTAPGDCRQYFSTGTCSRLQSSGECPYNHTNSIKGKGKGKGKKGKGNDGGKGKGKQKGKGKGLPRKFCHREPR